MFSDDKRALTSSDEGKVILWDLNSGKLIKEYQVGKVNSLALVPTEKQFATTDGAKVNIWNLASGT